MMNFILAIYIIGTILTGLYIAAQLIIELPKDIQRFKDYRADGLLHQDDSVFWFTFETAAVAMALAGLFPFFWFLESRRIKNGRY